MDFAKTGCFGEPPWEAYAIYAFLTIGVALFAWTALRRPSRPTWSLTGRRRRGR